MQPITAAYNLEDFDDFDGAGASGVVATPKGGPTLEQQRGRVKLKTVMNLPL